MKSVLILYPKSFKSNTKFSRKVLKIIQSLDSPQLTYMDDPHNFILEIARLQSLDMSKIENIESNFNSITHAIIFDDGEEFHKEKTILQTKNIPLRLIKILITRVVNINHNIEFKSTKSTPTYEYIGRGSRWGNPYSILEIEDLDENEDPRELVISNFKYDFEYDKLRTVSKKDVFSLAGKRLGCFCKPLACHGDILAEYLNSWDDGK